jgi:hypothetical protein
MLATFCINRDHRMSFQDNFSSCERPWSEIFGYRGSFISFSLLYGYTYEWFMEEVMC